MMEKKSLIKMGAALALVGAVGVGSTLAYITSQTETVTNTFAAAGYHFKNGDYVLNESTVSYDEKTNKWVSDEDNRTLENEYKNVLPGHVLPKDPTLTLNLNKVDVDSYLFVTVDGVDQALTDMGAQIEDWNMEKLGYTKLNDDGKKDGTYWKIVNHKEETLTDEFFTKVSIDKKAQLSEKITSMNFESKLIQADGFTSAQDAWNALNEN